MAIIETLETEKKRLLEAKTELQGKLDKFLRPLGREVAPPTLVTPERQIAQPVAPITREIGLKGMVTAVDMKNSLSEISLGKADGVQEGMKFYVTRGDQFICEILIIGVDAQKAVGVLERVAQQPVVGDDVATNL